MVFCWRTSTCMNVWRSKTANWNWPNRALLSTRYYTTLLRMVNRLMYILYIYSDHVGCKKEEGYCKTWWWQHKWRHNTKPPTRLVLLYQDQLLTIFNFHLLIVKTILESGIDLPQKTESLSDLKSLCLALLDNLNDKNLALTHQKKTNK